MTAPRDQDNPVRCVDRQRDFLHLQIDAPSPVQQNEMEAWCYFGCLRHPGEITFRPRAAKTKRVGRLAIEISHILRKGFVAPVETAWQSRAEHTEVLLRCIDLYSGVDFQKVT